MTQSLTFPYIPVPRRNERGDVLEERYFPLIPVRIIHAYRVGIQVKALLDSGSEANLFPAVYAESLGIPVKKGTQAKFEGIGGITVMAYSWEVKLLVQSISLSAHIDFSYEQRIPILGRNGFFDQFSEIAFHETEHSVTLTR